MTLHACIMGDFNFPQLNWDTITNPNEGTKEQDFKNGIDDAYLIQMVNNPTRRRMDQAANILDLVFVNRNDVISPISHNTSPIGKSDHEVLNFQLYIPKERKPIAVCNAAFDLRKGNYDKMREDMKQIDWSNYDNKDVAEIWDSLRDSIQKSMEENIPKSKKRKTETTKSHWMHAKHLKILKKKHKLYKRFLASKEGIDYQRYIQTRNECKHALRYAKCNYERNISNNSKANAKAFWKFIKSKLKSSDGIATLVVKTNGDKASSDKDKAELLNNYFASVFTRENMNNLPTLEESSRTHGFTLSEIIITPKAVEDKLKRLNPKKAQGPDRIPARVLKEISEEIATPLAILFNKSFEQGSLLLYT